MVWRNSSPLASQLLRIAEVVRQSCEQQDTRTEPAQAAE